MAERRPTPAPQAGPRRRARWLRWPLRLGALGLSLLLLLVLVLRSDWLSGTVARAVEAAIHQATGEEAVVGGFEVYPLRATLRLEGLVLTHVSDDPDKDGQVIAALEAAEARLGWRDGGPYLRRLELHRPTLRLHLDEGGLREFQTDESGGDGLERFPWDELWVHGGSVRVEAEGWSTNLDGIDIAPRASGAVAVDLDRLGVQVGALQQEATLVHLAGVVASPSALSLPAIDLRFPGATVAGDLTLDSAGPLGGNLTVRLELPTLDPLLTAPTRLEGVVHADIELGGATGAPTVEGTLSTADARVVLNDREVHPRAVAFGDLTAAWSWTGETLEVSPLLTRWAGGMIELRGTVDPASSEVQLSLSGEGLGFASVMAYTGISAPIDDPALTGGIGPLDSTSWVDFDADTEIQVGGTLSPLKLAGAFEVATRRFRLAAGPSRSAQSEPILELPHGLLLGEFELDPAGVSLAVQELSTPRSQGSVKARLGFASGRPLALEADFRTLDMSELRPLSGTELGGVARLKGRLDGPLSQLQAKGELSIDGFRFVDLPFADVATTPFEAPSMSKLSFPAFQAQLGASRYSGALAVDFDDDSLEGGTSVDLQVLLSQAEISDLTEIFFELPQVTGAIEGTFSLNGPTDRLNGESYLSLRQVQIFGERFDLGHARAVMREGRFTLQALELARDDGDESLLARGSVGAGWAMNMELMSGGLHLDHAALLEGSDVDLRGAVDVDIAVGGTLFAPAPSGRIAVRDAWFGEGWIGDGAVAFTTTGDLLSFEGGFAGDALKGKGAVTLASGGAYAVSAVLKEFPAHLLLPRLSKRPPPSLLISGDARVGGNLGGDASTVLASVRADRIALDWDRHALRSEGQCTWTQRGGRFELSPCALSDARTRLSLKGEGDFQHELSFSGDGRIDLDLMRMAVDDLEYAEGIVAVDLTVEGRRAGTELQFSPRLQASIQDATVRGTWIPEVMESLSGELVATPQAYLISDVRGRIGGGTMSAGGRIDAEAWVPVRYDLHGRLTNARVRYLSYLPPLTGDADLSFGGPTSEALMSGRIDIHDMVFADRIDWEDWVLEVSRPDFEGAVAEEAGDYFSMDIQVVGNDTVRVRNNVADLVASADLRIIGDTNRPGMVGDIRAAPGGRVYLKEREFDIDRGEIHFVDPFTYDPDLDIALSTEVRSRDEDYQVWYRVSGLYSDWTTETTSNPVLAQADINALLLFGMTREDLERYGGLGGALWIEGSDLLASKIGVVERVGEGIFRSSTLRPDRIDLISGSSARGSNAISSELRLLVEKDLTRGSTIIFEQELADLTDTYLGYEQRLARTLYSRAYWVSEEEGRHLSTPGAWGLEFNVRWELD